MYDKYKDDGVVVLGVHAWTGRESKTDVKKFVKDRKVTYPVLLGGKSLHGQMLGGNDVHRDLYKCKYVPRVFFIDRQGRIAATKLGYEPGEEKDLEKKVRELL